MKHLQKQDKARRKMTGSLDPIDPPTRNTLPENAPPNPHVPIDNKYSRGSWKTFFQTPSPHNPDQPPSFDFFFILCQLISSITNIWRSRPKLLRRSPSPL